MELNATYNAFFTLLRAGLWNREPDYGYFPLSRDTWKQVYGLARKQTVEGIVYDGIMQLPKSCLPPQDFLIEWAIRVTFIEDRNKRMNRVAGEIQALFAENHITALLMKGQGVASYYNNPLHRVCGDLDWSFPDKENFDRTNKLMEKKRRKIKRQAGFSACYLWKGVLIEHHRHLLDISNPLVSGYLHHVQQHEEPLSVYLDVFGQKVPLPSPVLTHLSVNSHILKHLLAFGISLRQLCDSARVCYAYHGNIEAESLRKIYGKLGIYPWIQLLNRLLVDYLGMPEEYLLFPPASLSKADFMMKDVLRGGNFGFYGGPFAKETDTAQIKRKHVWLQLFVRYVRYVRYAPWEACWFPVIHIYSHIKK